MRNSARTPATSRNSVQVPAPVRRKLKKWAPWATVVHSDRFFDFQFGIIKGSFSEGTGLVHSSGLALQKSYVIEFMHAGSCQISSFKSVSGSPSDATWARRVGGRRWRGALLRKPNSQCPKPWVPEALHHPEPYIPEPPQRPKPKT